MKKERILQFAVGCVLLTLSQCFFKPGARLLSRLSAKKNWQPLEEDKVEQNSGISFSVELPKQAGINWGSDLSFRWVYVLDLVPTGAAAQTGLIEKVGRCFSYLRKLRQ